MRPPVIAFYNCQGGVGTTSLVYHLAWMLAELGARVVAVDLDPQAALTASLLPEALLETIWELRKAEVVRSVQPTDTWPVSANLELLTWDARLPLFEEMFASGGQEASAFRHILSNQESDVVLVDLGPNLSAINRAALSSADYVIVPVAADLFALQGLRNVGVAVRNWGIEARPLGYVVQQRALRLDQPAKDPGKWAAAIPKEFRKAVLAGLDTDLTMGYDPYCLAVLKHYHSLMPMAHAARKPMFHLTFADGAVGSHFDAVQSVGKEYKQLAKRIAEGAGLEATAP